MFGELRQYGEGTLDMRALTGAGGIQEDVWSDALPRYGDQLGTWHTTTATRLTRDNEKVLKFGFEDQKKRKTDRTNDG